MSQTSDQLHQEPADQPAVPTDEDIAAPAEALSPVELEPIELAVEGSRKEESGLESAVPNDDDFGAILSRFIDEAEAHTSQEDAVEAPIPAFSSPREAVAEAVVSRPPLPAPAVAPAISIRADEATVPPILVSRPKLAAEPKKASIRIAPKNHSRFRDSLVRDGLQGAALALALGLGWIIGANTFDNSAEVHRIGLHTAALEARLASLPTRPAVSPLAADIEALRKTAETLQANAKNAKAANDAARTATAASLADLVTRIDHLADAQQDAEDSLTKLDARMDRLDRLQHVATNDLPTGSIAPVATTPKVEPPAEPKVAAAIPPVAESKVAAAIPPAAPPLPPSRDPPVQSAVAHDADPSAARMPANGYILRDVVDGAAVIESNSGLRTVKIGDVLPGAGRVESIERHGRQWVVVTSGGIIDNSPY